MRILRQLLSVSSVLLALSHVCLAQDRECEGATCKFGGGYFCEGDLFYNPTCMINTCSCNESGQVPCTRMACFEQCASDDDCVATVRSATAQSDLYPLCGCEARSTNPDIADRFDECLGEDMTADPPINCARARCANTCEDLTAVCNLNTNTCELTSTAVEEDMTFCTMDVGVCTDGTYVSRDGKNNCAFEPCPEGATLVEPEVVEPDSCTCEGEGGVMYCPGDKYTAKDGCNTCTCSGGPDGLAACTEMFCPPPDSDECATSEDCSPKVRSRSPTMSKLTGVNVCGCYAASSIAPFDECEGEDDTTCIIAGCAVNSCDGYEATCSDGECKLVKDTPPATDECTTSDDCYPTIRSRAPGLSEPTGVGMCECYAASSVVPFDECEGEGDETCPIAGCIADACDGYEASCSDGACMLLVDTPPGTDPEPMPLNPDTAKGSMEETADISVLSTAPSSAGGGDATTSTSSSTSSSLGSLIAIACFAKLALL